MSSANGNSASYPAIRLSGLEFPEHWNWEGRAGRRPGAVFAGLCSKVGNDFHFRMAPRITLAHLASSRC